MSLLKITYLWFCSNLQRTKCCFASTDVTAPFMKCDRGQWCNEVTVNTHCDVTMGRWRCLGNHISQQWTGHVAAAQGGASVQLYCKALRNCVYHIVTLHICSAHQNFGGVQHFTFLWPILNVKSNSRLSCLMNVIIEISKLKSQLSLMLTFISPLWTFDVTLAQTDDRWEHLVNRILHQKLPVSCCNFTMVSTT